jgi:hypothetical protein
MIDRHRGDGRVGEGAQVGKVRALVCSGGG